MSTDAIGDSRPHCPLCGREGQFSHRRADARLNVHPTELHDVYRCEACRIWFGSPMDTQHLRDYYPDTYYEAHASPVLRFVSRWRAKRRASVVAGGLEPGLYLDIGCGRGDLIVAMSDRGWAASGTDWNEENAKAVADRLGVEVLGGQNALRAVRSESLDAVSMFHVLEHDDDPKAFLEAVHQLLAPGARLVVAVPCGSSLVRALFGASWTGFDSPRHRVTFTRRALRRVLESSGFEVISIRGQLIDELLDLRSTVGLWASDRGLTSRLGKLAMVAVLVPAVLVARLFGFSSVVVARAVRC